MRYVVAENLEEIQPHINSWQSLADRQEDELFSTPEFLLPLLEHYPVSPYSLLFIYSGKKMDGVEIMIGFAPFRWQPRKGILLCSHLTLLSHPHIGRAQPYLHPDHGNEAVEAMLQWCRQAGPHTVTALYDISEDSCFYRHLRRALDKNKISAFERRTRRAVMRWSGQPEKYIREQLSSKKRKRLRNHKNRLLKTGTMRVAVEDARHRHRLLLDRFLDFDDGSTKGGDENSPLYSARDREFFHDIVENIGKTYTVSFVSLILDDRRIAMQFNIERKGTLFGYKTSYDPHFKRFSPGTLLEVEVMALFQHSTHLRTADSCTDPGAYIEQLWKERRFMRTVIIPNSWRGKGVLLAARFLEGLKKRWAMIRERLKTRKNHRVA